MSKTTVTISRDLFLINGALTYSEYANAPRGAQGLLMNARFVQGIFHDKADPGRFARFGADHWDPEENTRRLIAALPEWYGYGLRAFTVGLQGGGPCFTTDNDTIDNNPFGEDGKQIEQACLDRLDALIRGADEVGMVVIVSLFYGAQAKRIRDDDGIRNAVRSACGFLKESRCTNVLLEIANEHDVPPFKQHPIVYEPTGVVELIELARGELGGSIAIGCSGIGPVSPEIPQASDVILIHGNNKSRQQYYNLVRRVHDQSPGKPVVCNEDSPAVSRIPVALETFSSWGYYNNLTKQEPPASWGVTPGDDTFFALRMAEGLGIVNDARGGLPHDEYVLQGCEPEIESNGRRWIRVGALYPEKIDFVRFFRNGSCVQTCYDDPPVVGWVSNWYHEGAVTARGDAWKAEIHLTDGEVIEKESRIP